MTSQVPTILVVDDDPALRTLVALHLRKWGYRDLQAGDEAEMWDCVGTAAHSDSLDSGSQSSQAPVDLVLLDVHLGPADGSRLVAQIRRHHPSMPILMVTRSSNLSNAVRSLRSGARDYILKPIDFGHLQSAVEDALQWASLQRDLNKLRALDPEPNPPTQPGAVAEPLGDGSATDLGIVGQSSGIRRLREIIRRAAATPVPVLVLGETGTGKELVAQAIHQTSDRSDGPFVAVNAAAIPTELIESELFGHEKGAFTGATEQRIGFCERADGGTLFLDEIGEMEPSVQSKLLRFLQEHEVQRVGATATRKVDVRVVAATNVDPQAQIGSGRLREDLYYRLRGVQLELPPLRERGRDVELLANHFLSAAALQFQRNLHWSAAALGALAEAPWPGNVRQLQQVINEAAILAPEDCIGLDDLPAELRVGSGLAQAPQTGQSPHTATEPSDVWPAAMTGEPVAPLSSRQRSERDKIAAALDQLKGPAEAATALGMSRATLYRRMKRYGLKRPR